MSNSSPIFNREKLIQLIIGAIGIYFCYLVAGVIQQRLIKHPYKNTLTNEQQYFRYPIYFMLFPHGFTFILGCIYNCLFIQKDKRVKIPNKNSSICAFLALLGGITFNYAILWTNYPIVVTVKSCNLLSVILVGAFCTRVTDSKVKLSYKKIIVGIVATIGIILFSQYDPQIKSQEQKSHQTIGFIVLFISLLADGFLPDFQAQIKTKFKPEPTQMMVAVNKWVVIFSLIYATALGSILPFIEFILNHGQFIVHLAGLGLLNAFGQFFIYRMIKQFKQHIVPFVITTRKIFTVAISIIFYNHPTSFGQICGVLLVFLVVIYQFVSEIYQKKVVEKITDGKMSNLPQNQQNQLLQSSQNFNNTNNNAKQSVSNI